MRATEGALVVTLLICAGVPETRHTLELCAAGVRGIERIDCASSLEEAWVRIQVSAPDFVLLDAHLPGPADALRQLVGALEGMPVFMVGSPGDLRAMAMAMAAGVRGFLRHDLAPEELAATLAHASLPAPVAAELIPVPRLARPRVDLTERELQVLRGMSEGKSNSEIGRSLYLSEDTIKTHARRLFRKLEVNDRAHAVASGFRMGLVS